MSQARLRELLGMAISQGPLVIDVRSREEYEEKHIPAALNLPLNRVQELKGLFAKNKIIVTACGKGGGRSAEAAAALQKLGYENVYWLCEGTQGWLHFHDKASGEGVLPPLR